MTLIPVIAAAKASSMRSRGKRPVMSGATFTSPDSISRTASLNVNAQKAVQAYLEERRTAAGGEWLFMGKRGEQLKSPGIRHLVGRYAYNARLEDVTTTHAALHLRKGPGGRRSAT